ncbi:MAG TPA: type II CAAX endopeptidase family protein [Prolixibacteraceae bacterium]|nr:type II CAAX endopeptidase family protein [Prolixibacteraceae bacterium]
MKESFFPNRIIHIAALLIASIVLALPYPLIVGMNAFSPDDYRGTVFYVLSGSLFTGICCLVNYRRHQRMEWNFYPVDVRQSWLPLIVLLLFSIGIHYPVNNLILQLMNHPPELTNPVVRPIHAIGAILVAPVVEEIIYRGIVLKGLLTRYAPQKAILLSALIFGIMHWLPLQIWGASITGLILGWVYYQTKSIGTTILLHSLINTAVLISQYVFFLYPDLLSSASANLFLLILSIPLLTIAARQLFSKWNTLPLASKTDDGEIMMEG